MLTYLKIAFKETPTALKITYLIVLVLSLGILFIHDDGGPFIIIVLISLGYFTNLCFNWYTESKAVRKLFFYILDNRHLLRKDDSYVYFDSCQVPITYHPKSENFYQGVIKDSKVIAAILDLYEKTKRDEKDRKGNDVKTIRKHLGFTLIELMIVVVIVGILAITVVASFYKEKTVDVLVCNDEEKMRATTIIPDDGAYYTIANFRYKDSYTPRSGEFCSIQEVSVKPEKDKSFNVEYN